MWQTVDRKRRSGRRVPAAHHAAAAHSAHHVLQADQKLCDGDRQLDAAATAVCVEKTAARVQQHVELLRDSSFFKDALTTVQLAWDEVVGEATLSNSAATEGTTTMHQGRLLCLGIGSVEHSAASSHQLALAWLLAEELGITDRSWADPQMHRIDEATGSTFRFNCAHSEEALRGLATSSEGPLLLFMPHCDRGLYERVLRTTCGNDAAADGPPPNLVRTLLIGNSFSVYAERDELGICPSGSPGAAGPDSLVRRFRPNTQERRLPEYGPCQEAFNDLAVMSFAAAAAAEAPAIQLQQH